MEVKIQYNTIQNPFQTFSQWGNLKTHERIQTGMKPFNCYKFDKFYRERLFEKALKGPQRREVISKSSKKGEKPFASSKYD